MFPASDCGLRRVIGAAGSAVIVVLFHCVATDATADCAPEVNSRCTVIDFEDFPANTPLTSQYPGVTFSLVPQSCNNAPVVRPIIVNPSGRTSSGTRALSTEEGCPAESNPDYLRIVFDVAQRDVSFTVGESGANNYTVRAYTSTSGAAGQLLPAQTIAYSSGAAQTIDVLLTVRVSSAIANIRRIEVEAPISLEEYIDDLSFGEDTTEPEAIITYPADDTCLCGSVVVEGISCEPDGRLFYDQLHYQEYGSDEWHQIQSDTFEAPVCTNPSNLYTWNTADPSIGHGRYRLRLRSFNLCGCMATDEVDVNVDKLFDLVDIGYPVNAQIVGGASVCINGTVDDYCMTNYSVQYRPAAGGAWINMNPGPANPNVVVRNGRLATWDTDLPGAFVVDGNYQIRVTGTDSCGNTATDSVVVTVDNTEPVAVISAPSTCTPAEGIVSFMGTASDAHLDSWELHYVGGNAADWTLIADGHANVVNGFFADWDTTQLPYCCYAVRLRVRDQAVLNCGESQSECDGANITEYYITVNLPEGGAAGLCCDVNGDGFGNGDDVQPFVNCLISGVGGCQ